MNYRKNLTLQDKEWIQNFPLICSDVESKMKLQQLSTFLLATWIPETHSFAISSFTNPSMKNHPKFDTLGGMRYTLFSTATNDLAPGIEAINSMNEGLEELLGTLRDKPYFRLYSVDMLGSCEYMPQELFECYSETCEIYPVDQDEVCVRSCF